MLDTHKLIYILQDVAYVAEMLPGKKQHTFTVHNFRQVNGEYLKDDKLVAESVLKLFSKIDPDTYHLVLPDTLFTNTIVSTTETGDAKTKKYITDELLPSLELSTDTHYLDSFVLTEFKGVSKVQISALEKSLAGPIRAAAAQFDLKIAAISPLSWTIKSVVSLEPSVTVLQLGSMLYTALQYIGVDQANQAPTDDMELVSETIKTLKGSEPSIQTVYLLSNELVEKELKEKLGKILPVQSLAEFSEEENKMPSYVKYILEAGMRTLEISDYPVPKFELEKASEDDMKTYVAGNLDKLEADETDDGDEADAILPAPTPVASIAAPAAITALDDEVDEPKEESADEEEIKPEEELPAVVPPEDEVVEPTASEEEKTEKSESSDEVAANESEPAPTTEPVVEAPSMVVSAASPISSEPIATFKPEPAPELMAPESSKPSTDGVDLSKFAQAPPTSTTETTATPVDVKTPVVTPPGQKPVIKNKSGISGMLRMLLVMLVVFAITVAVGAGVGLGLLNLTNKQADDSATIEVSPSPESIVEATPEPTPEVAAIDRSEFDILIVNATDKAGYAGGTSSKLEAKEYKSVQAANAKGDYEPGTYVLMAEENPALIAALEEDSELALTYQSEGYADEDATGRYDAVIVLAE